MISSRDLKDLLPVVASMAAAFVTACRGAGIEVLITSTYRDNESQNALYAQGRTTPGKRVTNAKGGQSWHNHKCAFDFVPIVHGKAMWDDTRAFQRCGAIAQSIGLEWGGAWTSFKDLPHCQYTGGLTLADLQAGKLIK
jgi:peptidoglycan L-alanyl-D-glutamate endopeptidase CwlK